MTGSDRPPARAMALLLAATVAVALASFYLHDPETPRLHLGLKYTDIVHGVFGLRMNTDGASYWFDPGVLERLTGGGRACPVPYRDYKFEYPPVVGLLFYVSTCAGITFTLPLVYSPEDYHVLVKEVAAIHYRVHALVLSAALVATAVFTALLLSRWRLGLWRAFLLPLLPSTLVYSIYNWDVLAVAFLLASVYYYEKGRYELSGFLAGLSVSTKLLTGVAAIALATALVARGERGFYSFARGFLLAGVVPFAILYTLWSRGFLEFVSYHSAWYCENCLYMLLVRDVWSPMHKVLAAVSVALVASAVLVIASLSPHRLRELLFVSVAATTVLNYVFSPQMLLLLTPVALLSLRGRLLPAYVLADIINALVIVLFFWELGSGGNPWTLSGVTQKVATVRNLLLLALLAHSLYSLLPQPLRKAERLEEVGSEDGKSVAG